MRKLNCLIAVLEVATARVRKNMAGSPPDAGKLARICSNLQSTLEVCQRARAALERRQAAPQEGADRQLALPPGPPPAAAREPEPRTKREPREPKKPEGGRGKSARRTTPEIATEAERRKFAKLPPIDRQTILHCDFDELARRLCS